MPGVKHSALHSPRFLLDFEKYIVNLSQASEPSEFRINDLKVTDRERTIGYKFLIIGKMPLRI